MSSLSSIHRQALGISLTSLSTESRAAFVIVNDLPGSGSEPHSVSPQPSGLPWEVSEAHVRSGLHSEQQTHGAGYLSNLNGEAGFECSFCFELGTFVTIKQRLLKTFNWLYAVAG